MPVRGTPKEKAIKGIKAKISRIGIDALLVTGQNDIIYLTGFYAPGVILITRSGPPTYFVDPMNKTLAEKALKGQKLQISAVKGSIDGSVASFLKDRKLKRIGYDSRVLSVADYLRLTSRLPKARFLSEVKKCPVDSIIQDLREIKKAEEINILRRAARATSSIWRQVKKDIRPGMSERSIASMIDVRVRGLGYENSFPTIVAAGENSAYPHAIPMGRRLKKGEHLLVDFGIRHQGYCSDLTRIWADGRIGRKIRLLKKHVRIVQDKVIEKLKSGVSAGALAREANLYFKNNNLGDYVCHGLGHGVGLDIHEAPFLKETSRERLKEGMVVTIEPGLYMPGVGGIRLEDMVLITKNGYEVLTR